MRTIRILNAQVVNEGKIFTTDVRIADGRITHIAPNLSGQDADITIDAQGKYLLPGVIDDQVHFREPGLTHKAEIYTEARAAVAGGTTTFMEMPNTVPNALTQALLEEKYQRAAQVSLANYSFFMGVGNDNLDEVLRTDPKNVCGLKIFMGSSTGNMLVDNPNTLERVFAEAGLLIATHCEDEATVKANLAHAKELYPNDNALPSDIHAIIRDEEACYRSSSLAIALAKRHNTRLHILHISTAREVDLFDNTLPLAQKRITSEACVHHLWYTSEDYATLSNQIKCNPAIKAPHHREAVWQGLLDNKIDIVATDHAPHTWDEKQQSYWQAPAGLPLVQYALNMMLEHYHQGRITLERIVEKMSHAPAICFQIAERGFIREGAWADLVLVDLNQTTEVRPEHLYYKCGWSPLNGYTFRSHITHTIVSGHLAYANGTFDERKRGERISFDR